MKRILSILVIIVIMTSMTSMQVFAEDKELSDKELSDIEKHWAKDAIKAMSKTGVIQGYPDGTFKPDLELTREQFAKLISLTFNLPSDSSKQTFSDVSKYDWSYEFVEASKKFLTGYFPPYGQAFFDPQSPATREDVAVALVRTMQLKGKDNSVEKFKDYNDISPKLRQEVSLAISNEMMNGFPDGTFRPQDSVTRGQVATLLYRIIKNSYTDESDDIELEVNMDEVTYKDNVIINGIYTENAIVTINGKKVTNLEYANDGKEQCKVKVGLYDGFGTYKFEIKAKIGNNEKIVNKTVDYKESSPELNFIYFPSNVENETVKISGTLKDKSDDNPKLYINGEQVYISKDSSWEYVVDLKEGNNEIAITAINKNGVKTEIKNNIGRPFKATPTPEPTLYRVETTPKPIPEYELIFNPLHKNIEGYTGNPVNLIIPDKIDGVPVMAISGNAFENCISLVSVIIPESVDMISPKSFNNCPNLETVIIMNARTIQHNTFSNCPKLKSVALPDNLEIIRTEAFRGCTSLNQITIPLKVRLIESHAFRECYNLKDVYFTGSAPDVTPYPFSYVDPFPNIYKKIEDGFTEEWYKKIAN